MSFNKKIGNRITAARVEAGLTQEELAELLNLSRVSVVNMEKGRQACSIKRLMAISRITGYAIASIIDKADEGKELPDVPDTPDTPSWEGWKLPYELHSKIDKVDRKLLRAFINFHDTVENKQEQ